MKRVYFDITDFKQILFADDSCANWHELSKTFGNVGNLSYPSCRLP